MILLLYIIILFLLLGACFIVLQLYQKYHKSKRKRSPFTDNFLRSPGQSLNDQIQQLNEKININLFSLVLFPTIIWAGSIFYLNREINSFFFVLLITTILIVLSVMTLFLLRIIRLLNRRRSFRLGYEGEIATGQELNQLMLEGYHVFHDLPAGKFNIDHIIVGSTGVYAVETKARSKSISKSGSVKAVVIYDGKTIKFPDFEDNSSIHQAVRQAKWLQQWLEKSVGTAIKVQPIVAIPGWFIKRISPNGIPVLNPKNGICSFLKSKKSNVLDESMIQRINHQLEQKCRDIEPNTIQLEKENI